MKRTSPVVGLVLVLLFRLAPVVAAAETRVGDGVVRAVLFSSPTCPHCQKVRERCLPVLLERFGGRLQVAVLSTATESGRDLYWAAVQRYGLLRRGVPLLVIGETTLMGDVDIPEELPGLIARHLEQGGVSWPDIPGLAAVLAADGFSVQRTAETSPRAPERQPVESAVVSPTPGADAGGEPQALPTADVPQTQAMGTATPTPSPSSSVAPARAKAAAAAPPPHGGEVSPAQPTASAFPVFSPPRTAEAGATVSPGAGQPAPVAILNAGRADEPVGPLDRFRADPRGNGLAVFVLFVMLVVLLRSIVILARGERPSLARRWDWLHPVLALLGVGVAAYLANVEVRDVEAVCGPVGDCNTVQQSEYARLFGVLPIGVLGVVGFAAILVAWTVRRWGGARASTWAAAALLVMTGGGTLFSVYLTFLEPFVIGATCLWCVSSAVLMTALHVLALPDGQAAVRRRRLPVGGRPALVQGRLRPRQP